MFRELTSSQRAQFIYQNVYFRAEGDSIVRNIQPENYDAIIGHSICSETPADAVQPLESQESIHHPVSARSVNQNIPQDRLDLLVQNQVNQNQEPKNQHRIDQEDQMQAVQGLHDSQYDAGTDEMTNIDSTLSDQDLGHDMDSEYKPSDTDVTIQGEKSEFFHESVNVSGIIKYVMQNNTAAGKMELYHAFYYDHDFCSSEIFKIFASNMSLCVLVAKDLDDKTLRILEENEAFASNGLVVGSFNDDNMQINSILQKYSNFLQLNKRSQSYIFPIQENASELSNTVLDSAIASSTSKEFPSSWYIFGLILQQNMASRNLKLINVSTDCMAISEQLNMDSSATIAALQHLAENNMLLYFRDIMKDTVFSGVNVFSEIFSVIYQSTDSAIISEVILDRATQSFTTERFTKEDFIVMFEKLMIVAPYHADYLIPSRLHFLGKLELKKAFQTSNKVISCIKCPSKGYEYICMLTVFLLTVPVIKWTVLDDKSSGQHVCLHKNCIKFLVSEHEVTIAFSDSTFLIDVDESLPSEDEFSILPTILEGLEKVKLILNVPQQQSFEFVASFTCPCGVLNRVHYAVYDYANRVLRCEANESITANLPRMLSIGKCFSPT